MKAISFLQEPESISNLYPFTLTRSIQDIRVGILTIREKWEKALGVISVDPSGKKISQIDESIVITANLLPSDDLIETIKKLKPGQSIGTSDRVLVKFGSRERKFRQKEIPDVIIEDLKIIGYPWHIFEFNRQAIAFDFELLTRGRKSAPVDKTNSVITPKSVFVDKGARLSHCVINAEEGPVYIGKNALVMEGSLLRGPVSIGDEAVVKMGTKIYGATTIGPGCTVGGEIKNSVLFGWSNKAHDGYLGDSVIGEWCNLGAGTCNSNLKNTAGNIDVHLHGKKVQAGMKCGALMGDLTRTAINTSINTGTVIGVSANVFGNGLTPKNIPSFSWGFTDKPKYKLDKALEDANRWKMLKGQALTEAEKKILKNIYNTRK